MSGIMAPLLALPRTALAAVLLIVQVFLLLWACWVAYTIRLYPLQMYGMLIHEFDPWFNYRAAEYLVENGLDKFWKWYDYMSWYPLGRPIGTTIYPGMQMAAMAIRMAMLSVPAFTWVVPKSLPLKYIRKGLSVLRAMFPSLPKIPKEVAYSPLSVNDICCYIPPWFGSLATLFTGLLTYEITRSMNSAVVAAGVMSILPAHLMRSVGGEFDNECVAMTAICATFWLWLRSVRTPKSWPWGIPAGISYIYMVLAWGGYIFVINMVGIHALVLVAIGRFNSGVHKAYTLFFIIGTAGAVTIPVVGWQPLRSLEQMGPLLVFFGYQLLAFCDARRRKDTMTTKEFVIFRIRASIVFLVALAVVAVALYPTGYFGPLSARIRGLFVKHTKTGNPLVDSVAEHRPANSGIFAQYLNLPLDYAVHGAAVCMWKRSTGCYFAGIYAVVAVHFSAKMSRLVLICAPICSIACGIWWGWIFDIVVAPLFMMLGKKSETNGSPNDITNEAVKDKNDQPRVSNDSNGRKRLPKKNAPKKEVKEAQNDFLAEPLDLGELEEYEEEHRPGGAMHIKKVAQAYARRLGRPVSQQLEGAFTGAGMILLRFVVSFCIIKFYVLPLQPTIGTFVQHCHSSARSLANPKVVKMSQDQKTGKTILIDDYLKGYQWIDANTAKDARVMAWWDYGYQITGIAKRTSIADGNTWNHEHIATLGRTLTSPEKKAWNAIRHLADYVLVWSGEGGDLGKSPHLARIGNSVFPDHCGDDDPICAKYSFQRDGSPTPMMNASFLYKAVTHNQRPYSRLNPKYFQEVHTTKHGRMRIYKVMNISQESKEWVEDPKNRVCDAPGSWFCAGQYPPALDKLIAKRKNFAQVEDFNKGGAKSAYTKMVEKQRAGGRASEL